MAFLLGLENITVAQFLRPADPTNLAKCVSNLETSVYQFNMADCIIFGENVLEIQENGYLISKDFEHSSVYLSNFAHGLSFHFFMFHLQILKIHSLLFACY